VPTRNVVLAEHHEAFIGRLVATGRYRNASEVMREALRSLERQEEQAAAALGWLRGQVAPGLEQARRGELVDATLEQILDDIDRRLDAADERAG
jgi:antitoxin ParD1/3/4